MGKIILTLDEREITSIVNANDRNSYYFRRAVRAVLSDKNGQIALMYAKQGDYYKLPGGGVDEGEDLAAALSRELLEETGSRATVTKELGEVIEWRDFDQMNQVSFAYKAILIGGPIKPNLTQSEIDEGFEVRWVVNLDKAIKLVESGTSHEDLEVIFMSKRDAAILHAAH